ncbi:CAP-associated domain-containing protein [Sporosarcina sp. Te-1]|uniref:CAP domain-containing protein n=1 Tax=Sporosarcina sp. Te-1 TaxID=2818390 RepID=UPI001A9E3656|nr:CAP-associated domain-containing protein [Sporosarcina sp. Te-1]QTD42429.1 hypothetical protein J3U78_06350 [Sporosarcina sp. Te-1]
MKVIWKIALLLVILLGLFYLMDTRVKENEPLESPVKHGTAIPVPEKELNSMVAGAERPAKGLSVFVGHPADTLIKEYGDPDRVEPSAYGYDWWIYSEKPLFMVGVSGDIVNQVFSADFQADMSPFTIGQDVNEVYRSTIIESEVDVQLGSNLYMFSLKSEDIANRALVKFEDLYAQVYVDEEDGKIEGIRFIDPETLVIHQPYDMEYSGEMITVVPPSASVQMEVDRAMERQVFELTNEYRKNHDRTELKSDYWLGVLAREHSKDMALENYFSNESPSTGTLSDRLKSSDIAHRKAGENIAFNYVDAIEAVHGWLNSPAHRQVLLDEDFTELGTGVYGKYYTQDFIQSDNKKKESVNLNVE